MESTECVHDFCLFPRIWICSVPCGVDWQWQRLQPRSSNVVKRRRKEKGWEVTAILGAQKVHCSVNNKMWNHRGIKPKKSHVESDQRPSQARIAFTKWPTKCPLELPSEDPLAILIGHPFPQNQIQRYTASNIYLLYVSPIGNPRWLTTVKTVWHKENGREKVTLR